MLKMGQADSVAQFCQAVEPWHVPTFNLVVADVDGQIALQSAGRVPIRENYERGYRDGSDPDQQWQGLIPFEGMPHLLDPEREWIATANNRVAADDFPHLLSGCWASGWRARRIREMIEARPKLSLADMGEMQHDCKSLRAAALAPHLLTALDGVGIDGSNFSELDRTAVAALRQWDFCITKSSVAATIFNVFFETWCLTAAREQFAESTAAFVAAGLQGCAGRLLADDPAGWFAKGNRIERITETFQQVVAQLSQQIGPDVQDWKWEVWHTMPLRHVLSARGDLGELINHGGGAVVGDGTTVCNTGYQPDGRANAGGGYRMIADLASTPAVLLASDCQSQSGNPGSQHYADQLGDWLSGEYHPIPIDATEALNLAVSIQELVPEG
jgi:penicillin amidase